MAKKKTIAKGDLISSINKYLGRNAIFSPGSMKDKVIPCISTGLPTLDKIIGGKGVPQGKLIEIYGAESAGKSSFALSVVGMAQTFGKTVAYIDAENSFVAQYAERLGVDVNKLLFSQPECGEHGLQEMLAMARSKRVNLIILDSIPTLVPKQVLEGEVTDANMGIHVKMMNNGLRQLKSMLSAPNPPAVSIIFINQVRVKMGVTFGSNWTTPGGHMFRHYMDVRLEMKNLGRIQRTFSKQARFLGYKVQIHCVKNRVVAPFRKWLGEFIFNTGLVKAGYYKTIKGPEFLDEEIWDKFKCTKDYKYDQKTCGNCLYKVPCRRKQKSK